MTRPMEHSPVPQDQDSQLYWEAESERNKAAEQQSAAANKVITPMQVGSDPDSTFQKLNQSIADRSTAQTQGVIQDAKNARQVALQEEQSQYQKSLQDSLSELSKGAEKVTTGLNDKYAQNADNWKGQWQDYLSQVDQQNTTDSELWDGYLQYAQQQKEDNNKAWQDFLETNNVYVDSQGRINKQSNITSSGKSTYTSGSEFTGEASQIAQYAKQAGFPSSEIPTAVAVAMGESGGKADAYNGSNSNGSADYGLMQINSIHSGLLDKYDWKDPSQNMQMAYQIWKDAGGSWSPWVAYQNGSYSKFMDLGKSAVKSMTQKAMANPNMTSTPTGQLRKAIVSDAKQYFGLPYQWGGMGPDDGFKGFDCSGLVQQVYGDLGIDLPRTAQPQSMMGKRVSIDQLRPGDLVAWSGGWKGPNPTAAQSDPSYVGHIAIYAGDGKIIEARGSKWPVGEHSLRDIGRMENAFGVQLNFTQWV